MDFHRMKRKELQTLCKRHGVPANLTNLEMADRLASIYKENEKSVSLEKLSTNSEEIGSENEAKVVKKQAKKVRFSPENQTIEYEVSAYLRPTRSRKPLLSRNPAQAIENFPNCEDARKVEDCQVRVTRSRVQNAVEKDVNLVFSPPVGRKRRRGGMKNRDAEVNSIGKSEMLEMGEREDVKNGHDKVTGGLTGRQLRSRKNVNQEESTVRKGKRGDVVHLLDEIPEESGVVCEGAKTKNGRKQPTRNAGKEDQSVKLSSELEKVEVVSRVTRQSRAQPKDIASMVKSEVKTAGVQGGFEEVLQLKEPQIGRGKNAVPRRVSAQSSVIAAEKPLRRSKRNAEKDCAKTATSGRSETQVTKVQEQSERDIAFEEPPECSRRFSSRRNSVVPQSGKGGNKEGFSKKEPKKRSRTTELDAIMEHSSELERANYALQDQAPFRRSKRKTVILNPPAVSDAESANMEDVDKMQQLTAPCLVGDVTEELLESSCQKSSRYSLSATSKEGQIAVAKNDQEPSLEEEKTSVVDLHPVTEKPQRRSNRVTSIHASIAPCSPTAKVVEKRQPNNPRIEIMEEEAALAESLLAGKDELVVTEDLGNKNDLDLNCSDQAVKNADGCSNIKGKGAEKQCGFVEAAPLFLDIEEFKDSVGNMEESLIRASEKLVGLSTDQYMQQSTHKSMVEEENNLLGDDREGLVHCDNVESEINCMPSQSVNSTCVLDDANCSDPKVLELESNVSQVAGSTEINFPVENQGCGICDQEIKVDLKPNDTHSAHEPSDVYKVDRSRVNDKQRLIQVDSTDNEMNHSQSNWSLNGRGAVYDSNLLESRQVESESNVINMDLSDITSLSNGLSLADQRDHTGATSTLLNLGKELETEPPRGENTNFLSDNVNAGDGRTFGDAHILVELKDSDFTAAESMREAIFKDPPNDFGETSGLKVGPENTPKKAEEMTATDFSNREGTPQMESSVKATENQGSSVEFHFATAETAAPKITELHQSSYTAAPETPCGPTPGNLFKDKICRVEATDQESSEDLNPVNAHFTHESVLIYEENTGVVENDKEIRIHDDNSEGEMKYQSCLSLNGTGAIDDSNLLEHRMVDSESNGSKVVSRGITSPATTFSSVSQADLAGKTSSHIELEKVLETGEPSEKMNSIYLNMDAEGSKTPVEEDKIKVQLKDANVTAADSIGELIFSDLLNEFGETIGFNRGSEIPLEKSEQLSATECSDGRGVALTESFINATEKHEYRAQIDTAITGTPNITEIKWSSSSGTATCKAVFVSAQQSQDKLCNAGKTVSIARSEICSQDEETSLVEDDKEILNQDDIIEGETSNELKLEKVSESEESPRRENIYESNKIEVEDDKSSAQDEQNSVHLEDVCTNAAELVQEVVCWGHLNELCESCGTKDFEISLKKAEETGSDDSSGKGMVQTESSVDNNEKSEATVKIHTLAAEKTIMEMNWRESSHDTTLISPLRLEVGSQDLHGTIYKDETAVSNAGHGVCGHQENEENVKLEENGHDETINSEKDMFFSGKEILEKSFEGNFLVGGVCHRLSNSMGRQCAKDKKVDISDGSFYNVGETEEKHISKVLAEEGTDLVSSEGKDNYGEEVAVQCVCSSSIGLDSGIIVDSISKVCTLESTLNGNDPQSGTKVDDPNINEFEDGRKAAISHQSPLHGGKRENGKPCIGSSILCSSIPVSREKKLHPLVMDDMNHVRGAEITSDCKVTGEQRDTGGFSDVTDGSLVERSKGDVEEIAEAKSDDCEGSVKTATFMKPKKCDLKEADDSREVGSCDKLDIVSMKPKMVTDCSSFSSICATSDEHNDLENPDESDILINMDMSLFSGVEDEVKKPDANASDNNHSALDNTIAECNSSNLKEEDYVASLDVEDVNCSVRKDGPEDIEETMELTNNVQGLIAAMAEISPLSKSSDGRAVEHEEAFRSEQNLLSCQKKNKNARKERSNIACVKQFSSSIKPSLIQRTPKRLIIHDMKENEVSTKSKRTTPKTSSKRRPLDPVWRC